MAGFGRAAGGGRRTASRKPASFSATVATVSSLYSGALADLSLGGAQIRGDLLPPEGMDVWIRVGQRQLFGMVRWRSGKQCGVEFFEPLSPFELSELLRELEGDGSVRTDVREARDEWFGKRLR